MNAVQAAYCPVPLSGISGSKWGRASSHGTIGWGLGPAVTHAMLAWAALWAVLAALACVRLLRASGQPEPSVKNGYRWFAVAAVCVAAGAIVQQAFGGLAGGAQPLRLADLISLAALPALVIGLATLTARFVIADNGADGRSEPGQDDARPAGRQ